MSLGRQLLRTTSRGSRSSVVPPIILCVCLCWVTEVVRLLWHASAERARWLQRRPSNLRNVMSARESAASRKTSSKEATGRGSHSGVGGLRSTLRAALALRIWVRYYRRSPPRLDTENRHHCLGHCHPKVSKAAAEQCLNLVHGQVKHPFPAPWSSHHLSTEPDWHRVSRALSATHRTSALYHAAQLARLVLFLEFGLRGG